MEITYKDWQGVPQKLDMENFTWRGYKTKKPYHPVCRMLLGLGVSESTCCGHSFSNQNSYFVHIQCYHLPWYFQKLVCLLCKQGFYDKDQLMTTWKGQHTRDAVLQQAPGWRQKTQQ